MNFCHVCGNQVSLKIPANDDRERYVCDNCGEIHYQNPRIIVCTLPCHEDRILLCRRAIEPRVGFWTLPGGFMENDETTLEGAIRETMEEACARIDVHGLYTLFNLPHINQVHMFYRATLLDLDYAAGIESLEVDLFRETEIPWHDIAFPAVSNTLELYFRDIVHGEFPVRSADVLLSEDGKRFIKPHH